MSKGNEEWFVSRSGERFGPVTFEQLIEAANGGRLEPRTDLIYGGDLEEWIPAGEMQGLFEKKEGRAAEGGQVGLEGGMAATADHAPSESQTKLQMPGAPRLGYFLGVMILPAILAAGLSVVMPDIQGFAGEPVAQWLPLLIIAVPLLVAIMITVKRFQNLAMSGWWLLGLMVPLLNIWLQYRLLVCPAGYGFTKKLDGIGKLLAVLFGLLILVSIALPFVAAPQIKKALESDQARQALQKMEELQHVVPLDLPAPAEDQE